MYIDNASYIYICDIIYKYLYINHDTFRAICYSIPHFQTNEYLEVPVNSVDSDSSIVLGAPYPNLWRVCGFIAMVITVTPW